MVPFEAGRFIVVKELAKGGMGEILVGVNRETGERRALKRLLPEHRGNSVYEDFFLKEAALSSRVHHPRVLGSYGAFCHDGILFLEMDLLDGVSLEEVLRDPDCVPWTLDAARAVDIVRQICEGLDHLHHLSESAGIVHGDISPKNIMVLRSGDVKIIDLGVARRLGEPVSSAPRVIYGTPGYVSPEQCNGARIDARADLYATAVLLRNLLTGRASAARSALGTLAMDADLPRTIVWKKGAKASLLPESAIPRHLVPLLEKALAHDPDQRFQSAAELASALACCE